ncbi:MAG: hypothetical protein FWB80_01885 [Defluviitaleaceae bacterium]|nr:hypothetical protein [Defluviitaleaceae bacterium]
MCKKYENFIMQYFEKTIEPKNAKELVEHMLICEDCRELYTTMDASYELAGQLTDAPEDFTQNVMSAIAKEKKHVPKQTPALHLIWGISALLIGLFLLFNPEIFTAAYTPIIETFTIAASLPTEEIGIFALILTAITGALLYVLHNGEKVKT